MSCLRLNIRTLISWNVLVHNISLTLVTYSAFQSLIKWIRCSLVWSHKHTYLNLISQSKSKSDNQWSGGELTVWRWSCVPVCWFLNLTELFPLLFPDSLNRLQTLCRFILLSQDVGVFSQSLSLSARLLANLRAPITNVDINAELASGVCFTGECTFVAAPRHNFKAPRLLRHKCPQLWSWSGRLASGGWQWEEPGWRRRASLEVSPPRRGRKHTSLQSTAAPPSLQLAIITAAAAGAAAVQPVPPVLSEPLLCGPTEPERPADTQWSGSWIFMVSRRRVLSVTLWTFPREPTQTENNSYVKL